MLYAKHPLAGAETVLACPSRLDLRGKTLDHIRSDYVLLPIDANPRNPYKSTYLYGSAMSLRERSTGAGTADQKTIAFTTRGV